MATAEVSISVYLTFFFVASLVKQLFSLLLSVIVTTLTVTMYFPVTGVVLEIQYNIIIYIYFKKSTEAKHVP